MIIIFTFIFTSISVFEQCLINVLNGKLIRLSTDQMKIDTLKGKVDRKLSSFQFLEVYAFVFLEMVSLKGFIMFCWFSCVVIWRYYGYSLQFLVRFRRLIRLLFRKSKIFPIPNPNKIHHLLIPNLTRHPNSLHHRLPKLPPIIVNLPPIRAHNLPKLCLSEPMYTILIILNNIKSI